MRIMGIDYGEKRVGVAVSDESARFAFPLEVLENGKNIFEKLRKICREKEIKEIILGLPSGFKAEPPHSIPQIKKFKTALEEETGRPVFLEDEILNTREAERIGGRHKKTDASAAALILKTYLDRKNLIE